MTESITNGFDALIVVSESKINQGLFKQYATGSFGALTQSILLNLPGTDPGSYIIFNLNLCTPLLSFSQQQAAQLQMLIGPGSFMMNVTTKKNGKFVSLYELDALTSRITGAYPLSTIAGSITGETSKTTLGTVVLNMGESTSWSSELNGMAPRSLLSQNLNAALQEYFGSFDESLSLGSVASSTKVVPECLSPTSFTFTGFPQTGANSDGVLVFQVVTTGNGGKTLNSAPSLPSGADVAIYLSADLFAQNILTPKLSSALGVDNWVYTKATTNTPWTVTPGANQGLKIDLVSAGTKQNMFYSGKTTSSAWTGQNAVKTSPTISLDGLCFSPNSAQQLQASLTSPSDFSQSFVNIYMSETGLDEYVQLSSQASCSGYQNSFDAVLSTGTTSTFALNLAENWGGKITITQTDEHWITPSLPTNFASNLSSGLTKALNTIEIDDVNEFLLSSLVSPAGTLQLSAASLPSDLLTIGTLAPVIPITPNEVVLGPGGSITLQATVSGTETVSNWSVLSGLKSGSLSKDGNSCTYTAPSTVAADQVVVVEAVTNLMNKGFVLIAVQPQQAQTAIQIPVGLVLPTAATYTFTALDTAVANGLSLTASAGTLAKTSQGYTFTSPTSAGSVTVSAKDTKGNSFATTWQVAEPVTLSITGLPTGNTVKAGQTAKLVASGGSFSNFFWTLANNHMTTAALGSLSAATGVTVTYTAPTTVNSSANGFVQICAISGTPIKAVGFGMTSLNIVASTST